MITNKDGTKILEPGDRIRCQGIVCTIKTISYQEYWKGCGFRTEFTDTDGNYRSWKQDLDGGDVVPGKKYFSVTFQYSETTYCSNIAHAKSKEAVEEYYGSRYGWCEVKECTEEDFEEAKRKGEPVVEVPEKEEKEKCVRWKRS